MVLQVRPPPPLAGITLAWKDTFDIAGSPTVAGTRFLDRTPATQDHGLVAAMSSAGAVCVGKTSLTELAYSVLGENDVGVAPTNPHDAGRLCGGSSSGSAAVVGRNLVDAAIGTDSGGSVRLPAAWCGVVGFKPSRSVLDPRGAILFSPTLDAVGTLTRTVELAARLHPVLRAETMHIADPVTVRIAPLRLSAQLGPEPSIGRAVDRALHRISRHVRMVGPSRWDPLSAASAARGQVGSLAAAEGAASWRDRVLGAGNLASARLRGTLHAMAVPGPELLASLRRRRERLIAAFAASVPSGTVLALPSAPIDPPRPSDLEPEGAYEAIYARAHSLLWPFNDLDAPAISLPCGRSELGLPVGLALVAPRGRDVDVLTAARLVEEALRT